MDRQSNSDKRPVLRPLNSPGRATRRQPASAPTPPGPEPGPASHSGGGNRRWLLIGGIGCAAMLGTCVVLAVLGSVLFNLLDDEETVVAETPTVVSAQETTPTPESTPRATPTPEPTATAEPGPTPAPTATPVPTATPAPTATPEPTPAPEPTATPAPPPEPVFYAGSGDDVINIEKPEGPESMAVAFIQGNAEAAHFAVTAYGDGGEYITLLVNTTDPYDGTVPIDFDGSHTTQLEITSSGNWEIELRPLGMTDVVMMPDEIRGTGDHVFRLDGQSTTAVIQGNQASSHFAVIGHGSHWDLMVNTTDPYDGRVRVDSGTWLIEVTATGDWHIEFE